MRISDWSSDVCSSDLHAQAVDHGGVAVGADAGVGIGDGDAVRAFARPDALRDIFQIDLMADAGARGDGIEVVERLRNPFQEVVAQIGRASCRERVFKYV